jgi:hypothetical protein
MPNVVRLNVVAPQKISKKNFFEIFESFHEIFMPAYHLNQNNELSKNGQQCKAVQSGVANLEIQIFQIL